MSYIGEDRRQHASMHPEVIDRLARIETHIETMVKHVEKQNGRVSTLEDKFSTRTWSERLVVGAVMAIAAIAGFLNGNH